MKRLIFKYLRTGYLAFLFFLSSISITAQWTLPNDLLDQIDAAVYSENQESILFFASDMLAFNSFFLEKEVQPIALHDIPNFPQDWKHVDAAIAMESTKLLLFNGHRYCELDVLNFEITSQAEWLGLPAEWNRQLDAAVYWNEDNYLFFMGHEYIVYDATKGEYGELELIVNWDRWPTHWENGFSASANIGDGYIYFFRENEYLAFDLIENEFIGPLPMNPETANNK